jgi:acyl-CoA thioester hydrolase
MNESSREKLLAGFPVVVTLPVQWGDHDAFGHVNNTVPLRWFETSRIALLERCGLGHLMSGEGLGPVVASLTCNYRRQLLYPDHIDAAAKIEKIGRTSMTLKHVIVSHRQEAITADGQTVVVFIDFATNRPHRVPDEVRAKLLELQKPLPD